MGIEFDGLYWHSESVLEKRGVSPKNYHLIKTKLCQEKNIRLIHIFEDEWVYKQDIVKSRLTYILGKITKTVGARKTIIKEIETTEKNKFLNNNHIQGTDKSTIKLGAFYEENLIGVMTFSKPRIALGKRSKKGGNWELSRFAVKSGLSTPGLAQKMFKYFIDNYNYTEIYSYSDIRWNTGNIYKQLGFEYRGDTFPNYWYIVNQNRFHRFKYRKQELPKLLEDFNADLTEYENMLNNGIDRTWDCGNSKWIFT